MNVVIDSTKMYRGHFASSLQASQFTLPASLHLLPLFIISLLKHVSKHLLKTHHGLRLQSSLLEKKSHGELSHDN